MKKEHKKRYPDNWTYISAKIKYERAKLLCERCGLMDGEVIRRYKNGKYSRPTSTEIAEVAVWSKLRNKSILQGFKHYKLTRIVLVVAHLDHNENNNIESNLLCLCQRCHFNHDRKDNQWRAKNKQYYGTQKDLPGLFP
ncbi:MAG TPA: hypothetical protein VK566_02445 [Nitrososphaeraceae archaeon]|nr:hypothetical protein [Nitrososphaeraceae archaeon]